VAWAGSTAYVATAPASCVTYLGETYVCTTGHTSTGTFDASKFVKIAAKGSDGAGSGTVTDVAALTLGTSGTDLSSSVANGTTTPAITLNVPTASASNRGALSAADWSTFNGKQAALGFTPENSANKGAAGGYAPLDGSSKIASTYLPSYVDDVLEYANQAAFPGTGETAKIYVALDTNKTYRWSGSAYVEISPSPGSTDSVTEGSTNLYFTASRVLNTVLTGLSTAAATVVTASHTVLEAIGFLQKQITDLPSATQTLTNKRFTPRVGSTTSSATPTINTDNVDIYKLTAQTADITSFTTNLTGTPTDGQVLIIEITGTAARAITWGASFEASTVALPTTTVTTNMLAVGFIYNSVTSKWRCMGAV